MTTSITVRLSRKEREQLVKYGKISEVVREALCMYLNANNSKKAVSRLKELQTSTAIRTGIEVDLKLIRADRLR